MTVISLEHTTWPNAIVKIDSEDTGYAYITAPFRDQTETDAHNTSRLLIGVSSYQRFPEMCTNPHDYDSTRKFDFMNNHATVNRCVGWLHCLKNQSSIPDYIPRLLWSESDNTRPDIVQDQRLEKVYDFVYVCLPGEWNEVCRNKKFASRIIKHLCASGKRVLWVGRANDEIAHQNLTYKPTQVYHELMKLFGKSRYLLVPNVLDASPRVITEALCSNIGICVNENIAGGWKYVNNQTGVTINEDTFAGKLMELEKMNLSPRKWYLQHHRASKIEFVNFINKLKAQTYNVNEMIEYVLYINLAHRTDRKNRLELQLKEYGFTSVQRVDAVLNKKNPHKGCCASHIKALETALTLPGNNMLILEDDFEFVFDKEVTYSILKHTTSTVSNWDVIKLGANLIEAENITASNCIRKVEMSQTSHGYLITKSYVKVLLECFRSCYKNSPEDLYGSKITEYALDKAWFPLQRSDNWYITKPKLGKQYESYSDIMDGVMNSNSYEDTIAQNK